MNLKDYAVTLRETLQEALNHPMWKNHFIGRLYSMDGSPGWKIAYYPIFEDEGEPKALVERPAEWIIKTKGGKTETIQGTDLREVPLRYLVAEPEDQDARISRLITKFHGEGVSIAGITSLLFIKGVEGIKYENLRKRVIAEVRALQQSQTIYENQTS